MRSTWTTVLLLLISLGCPRGWALDTQDIVPGFYPSLGTGYLWTDNVLRSERNERADTLYVASPNLLWKAGSVRYDLDLGYRGNYGVYRRLSDQDYMDHTLFTGIGFHPADKMGLEVSDQLTA